MEGEIDELEVDNIQFEDLSVIGIGELEYTIAFEVYIDFHVGFDCYSSYGEFNSQRIFTDDAECISGGAKVILDEKWNKVESVRVLDIDETEVVIHWNPYD